MSSAAMPRERTSVERDRWTGVYIGILAVILAICSMGGGNAAKDATLKNIEAANTWSFFQAKNLRRQALRLRVDELETLRDTNPSIPEATKAAIEGKIAAYKAEDQTLTSNEKTGEGLDQLWTRGKSLEAERDRAMQEDPYFDYAEAFLQIAIVLASIAIISGGTALAHRKRHSGGSRRAVDHKRLHAAGLDPLPGLRPPFVAAPLAAVRPRR